MYNFQVEKWLLRYLPRIFRTKLKTTLTYLFLEMLLIHIELLPYGSLRPDYLIAELAPI